MKCALAIAHALACNPGGAYVVSEARGGAKRGETNGTMFDLVITNADGDQWTFRLRDNSLWAAYAVLDQNDALPTVRLTDKERDRLWHYIDAVDIPKRRIGKPDTVNGSSLLRLRLPRQDGDPHDVYTVYVSRDGEPEAVTALHAQLAKLIGKYHKRELKF